MQPHDSRKSLIGYGSSVGGQVVDVRADTISRVHSWPGIPAAPNYSSVRYRVQATLSLPYALTSRPLWWSRVKGTMGATSLPSDIYGPLDLGRYGHAWMPHADTISSTASTVTLATNVYDLIHHVTGEHFWWPCEPTAVRFEYTYIGNTLAPTSVEAEASRTPRLVCTPSVARQAVEIALAGLTKNPIGIAVHDVQGRVVREFRVSATPAGTYRGLWDLKDAIGDPVRPGIYFVRAVTMGYAMTRRVIVIR